MSYRSFLRVALTTALLLLSLLPASVGHTAAPAVVLPTPQALGALLTSTLRPTRDLYALTERLKLHTTTQINPIVNATPTNYSVGRIDPFFIGNGNNSGFTVRKARLALVTAHAYFYVQVDKQVDMKALARSAATFENHTYPTDHAVFGMEWTPGVDNDHHITIFNGKVPDVSGYFSLEDLYPRAVNPYSNQRKMIFMSLDSVQPGSSSYDSVLAHEFQHMIHVHLHPADEAWINEGSSILAQVLNGYTSSGFDGSKAASPDTQLNAWDTTNYSPYYGGGYLWLLYLYEHFGGAKAIHTELTDASLSNMALFDDVLAKLGVPKSANDVFTDWVIANFLNDRSLANGRYGYSRSSVKSSTTTTLQFPFTYNGTMHQYAANYLDLPNLSGKAFTLRFTGNTTVPLLGTVAPPEGFWWSNRGDNVDTTLTLPPLDLRNAQHATLHYQAWYDLEPNYDYGFVEVSTDGGQTWYSQRTAHTTDTNPNGANIDSGYTASSCSPSTTAQHCWVDDQVDLSPYAGKQVLVRFEQVTDDEYNGQGLAIAHIQIPEIGFSGDTTATGWQPAGWVRSGNALSENWTVQAIVYQANQTRVLRMTVGADGRGTLHIPASANRVVVVVSPTAPLTTQTNAYTLSGES